MRNILVLLILLLLTLPLEITRAEKIPKKIVQSYVEQPSLKRMKPLRVKKVKAKLKGSQRKCNRAFMGYTSCATYLKTKSPNSEQNFNKCVRGYFTPKMNHRVLARYSILLESGPEITEPTACNLDQKKYLRSYKQYDNLTLCFKVKGQKKPGYVKCNAQGSKVFVNQIRY